MEILYFIPDVSLSVFAHLLWRGILYNKCRLYLVGLDTVVQQLLARKITGSAFLPHAEEHLY